METQPPTEERFKTTIMQLAELIKELMGTLYEKKCTDLHPGLIAVAVNYINKFEPDRLINNFIYYTYNHWDKIHARDATYFEKDADSIFSGIPVKVDVIRSLYTTRDEQGELVINVDDQASIWDFFNVLVKMSIRYIHEKRKPTLKSLPDGSCSIVYLNPEFCTNIQLEKYAKLWKVNIL